MRELLHAPRIGLRFALRAADDGFVNTRSDLSRGNASVEGLETGWGEGLGLGSCVAISSTQFVTDHTRRGDVRALVPVTRLTLCGTPRQRGSGPR